VLPSVILLDLNLPKIDGLEVLRRLREHERTKHLPVVVLTVASDSSQPLPSPSRQVPTIPPSSTGTSASVLVVDDDQDISDILSEILTRAGHSVVTARNGLEALEKLKSVRASLILLDLNMPIMDGFEFRRLQRLDPAVAQVPTVVMSALHQMRERIARLAVDDALAKPIALERLLQVVGHFCGNAS
jgi:CheY-like chemotaxis protein